MTVQLAPSLHKQVETLFREGITTGIPDRELLDRFLLATGDAAETAFAALVDRHGAMVLRICRRILGDAHEAEDAAQAAFLVLARKARSIRHTSSLAGWIYEVAYRTAARARVRINQTRRREHRGDDLLAHIGDNRKEPQDWTELYEELGRLPERFRLPIVLCHLEGLSYQHAAEQLGCPVRTIQSRLARGRDKLRERLVRRGLAPAAGMASMLWTSVADARTFSVAWSQATAEAASQFAAHGNNAAGVSSVAMELAEGAIKVMTLSKLRILAAAGVVMLLTFGLAASAGLFRPTAADTNDNRYIASFQSGATIEVIGVSTLPTGPDTWWKPDGSPLSPAPVDAIESQFGGQEARGARVILVRTQGMKADDTFRWLTTRSSSYWGGVPARDGQRATGFEYYKVAFDGEPQECEIQARLATGPWAAIASDAGAGGVGMVRQGHKFDFGKARPIAGDGRMRTAMAVGHDISGHDKRLVAIDRSGSSHIGVHSISPSYQNNCLLDAEFALPPDRVAQYQVQTRPFESALISAIYLRRPEGRITPAAVSSKRQDIAPTPNDHPRDRATELVDADSDSDGDGLSDFQEIHKYGTDPKKLSSAGDGVSDGDWQRRREFAYTIRSVVKVMPPVGAGCLNDDYQDARVLSRTDHFVELEIIHYPLNTNAEAIRGNRDWKQHQSAMKAYLAPGITTNWDAAMQRDLARALRSDGIEPDRLDDKELVTRSAAWLMGHSTFVNMFCTHYIYFPDGRATIFPGLEGKFETDKGDRAWTVEQQFDHELFGKSMFANRVHGTCTSSAVFLTTALRALGIPTRMVLGIPLADGNDSEQNEMVRNGIHHHRVRQTILNGLGGARGYANHTFNEVFVGGRWVRLNYSKLGQNTLDSSTMGLLTHVNTFNDLSEVPLAATWGKRYALGERDEVFRYGNPYRCVELSDHFGKFSKIENPQSREHRFMTVSRAYWANDPDAPDMVKRVNRSSGANGPARLFMHGQEWFDDQPWQQLKTFLQAAGKEIRFQAAGQPDVVGKVTTGSCTSPSENVHEIEVMIPSDEYAKMKPGIAYKLVPRNEVPGYDWKIKGSVTIVKAASR